MPDLLEYKCHDFTFRHALDESLYPGTYIMHTHEEIEIYVFIKGRGSYIVEGTEYELLPRDILIMRNAEAHMPVIDENIPYERIVFSMRPNFLKKLDPSGTILRPAYERPLGERNCYRADEYPDDIWGIMEHIVYAPYENENLLRLLISGAITHIAAALAYAFDSKKYISPPDAQLPSRIIKYVNAELSGELSLDKICEHFFISKSQLGRIFKDATGTSIWEYISIKRLIAARDMIKSGVTAKEACTLCGFNDYSAFYRAYKAKFHTSPGNDKSSRAK